MIFYNILIDFFCSSNLHCIVSYRPY